MKINKKKKASKLTHKFSLPNNDTIISLIYANKHNHLFPEGKSHYGSAIIGAKILRDYLKGKRESKKIRQ